MKSFACALVVAVSLAGVLPCRADGLSGKEEVVLRAKPLVLAERGKEPTYTIVLPKDASPSQKTAADELQKYICEMTGVRLPIGEKPVGWCGIFLGNGTEDLGADGFRIVAYPPHVWILGGKVHGTLFGVYDFLERYCGCEWLSPTTSVVPKRDRVTVPGLVEDRQVPAFELPAATTMRLSGSRRTATNWSCRSR